MDIYDIRQEMQLNGKRIQDLPLKVTYYARVSTLSEEQENSIENQIAYFEEYIAHLAYRRPDVVLVAAFQRGEPCENLRLMNMLRSVERIAIT